MLEPYTYITANTGKKTTEKIVQAFNLWLNVPKDKLAVIIRVVSLFHNAGLLYVFPRVIGLISTLTNLHIYRVDDIEDGSQLRRGITGMSVIGDIREGVIDIFQSRIKYMAFPVPSMPPITSTS